ncbi:hypothetical protein PITCH_A840067 [uncultured Desulfobacterium sp.]|uniref:Uncharacterized protein n=1 Tax=uncultured Desulfobacterium sp. TaxID=201089 RepID=A0A445N3B3_9BACT|nr:hypothetical protein PITCH_A840067 [uncultured Desulfobacterium sp.]
MKRRIISPMLLQRPRYPEKCPNRQRRLSLKRALSFEAVRIKLRANAAVVWNDLKICALSKQTPTPCPIAPGLSEKLTTKFMPGGAEWRSK